MPINEMEIKKIVSKFKQLPYLFVGTGLSMRYSDAPSWDSLLFRIWSCMNDGGEDRFKKFKQGVIYELKNNNPEYSDDIIKYHANPRIASKLEKQFNDLYYSDDTFESRIFSREVQKEIIDNSYNPFKTYVALIAKELSIDSGRNESEELKVLIDNKDKIAGVITTNYDNILSEIFSDFNVIIGQKDILLSNVSNIYEIYKIHGCCTNPNSLVFTEQDYKNFEEKLKYLSAKLLTILAEHPIIFIGYGIGDKNILNIFEEIAFCLNDKELEKTKDNFILISPAFGGEECIQSKILKFKDKSIYMTEIILEDYSVLYKELGSIKSTMPIKLIRQMQDMVTNYIYSTEMKNNILFGSVDSPDIDDDKVALFIGPKDMVSQIGFDSFGIMDIIEDVLFDNKPFIISEKLITHTFKNIRSTSGGTLLPIYKYIKELNFSIENVPENYNIIRNYDDVAPNPTEVKSINSNGNFSCIQDIINCYPDHMPKQFANIKYYADIIDTEELGDYLRDNFKNGTFFEKNRLSAFKRLTALYDFKKYK